MGGLSLDNSHDFQTCGRLSALRKRHTLIAPMNQVPVLESRMKRRAAVRYKLRLPVIFHWNDGMDHTEGGFTSDVALDGALILSSRCPPVGSDVRIQVLLPAPDGTDDEIRIECSGKVVRVADHSGGGTFDVHGSFKDDQLRDYGWL